MDVWSGEIARAAEVVGELARRDVAHLTHSDLLAAHEEVARLGRLTGALQARFAGEIARRSRPELPGGGLARRHGFGSAGALISRSTGGTQAQARRSIEAGQALLAGDEPQGDDAGSPATRSLAEVGRPSGPGDPAPARYPTLAEGVLDGELSVEVAAMVASCLDSVRERVSADDLRALEQRLVAKAKRLPAHDVRRLVTRAVAHADAVGHRERERRQHAERYVSWSEDRDGMVHLTARLDPVTAAPLRTAIEQIVTHNFRARRDQDPREADQRSVGQMRADALFTICRHALGCRETEASGIRTTVVVRVDRGDLDRGSGLATIDGMAQPVSVGELERLAGDSGVVREVLGREGEVLRLERTARLFSRAQRLALLERDGGCAKCHAPPEHCEAHHIKWWDSGGFTDLDNGVMLCTRCHHDVHRQGWDIVTRPGRVEFIPPPSIDPQRQPILGGVAALDAGVAA